MTEKVTSKKEYSESNFQKDFQEMLPTNTDYTIHIRTNGSPIDNIISPKQDRFQIISFADLKVEDSFGRIFLGRAQVETSRDPIYQKRFLIVCVRNDKKTYIILNHEAVNLLLRRYKNLYEIKIKWLDNLDVENKRIRSPKYYKNRKRLCLLINESKIIFVEGFPNLGRTLAGIFDKIAARDNPLI